MNRPILVLNAREIMKCANTFVRGTVYVYIYICNELIEETVGLRKLIFGM